MGKVVERIRERPMKASFSWKEHPLIVAAASCAGTAAFMYNIVMPITNAALNAKLEALTPTSEKISSLVTELDSTKKKLKEVEGLAAIAVEKTPFLPGSVYPAGVDQVLIGTEINQVLKTYPSGEWDEDKSYYSVSLEHPHIHTATFYFDKNKENRKVRSILFFIQTNKGLNTEAIKARFRIIFGPPTATGKGGAVWWQATPRESVDVSLDNAYVVAAANDRPFWAQPIKK
jgi:hypothetical protein